MTLNMPDILFSFTLFSMLGWIMEVCYRSMREGHFINPGLLKGPYLILYGAAALDPDLFRLTNYHLCHCSAGSEHALSDWHIAAWQDRLAFESGRAQDWKRVYTQTRRPMEPSA